jgi:hypothetical protein
MNDLGVLAGRRAGGRQIQRGKAACAGNGDICLCGVDSFQCLKNIEVLVETLLDVAVQTAVVEGLPPSDLRDIPVTGCLGFGELARQGNLRRRVIGTDNAARKQQQSERSNNTNG